MASCSDEPGNKEDKIAGFVQEIHEILRNEHGNKIDISLFKAAYEKKFKRELNLTKLGLGKPNGMLASFRKIAKRYDSSIVVKKDGKSYCIQIKAEEHNTLSSKTSKSAKKLRDRLTENQLTESISTFETEDKDSWKARTTAPERKDIPLPFGTKFLNLQEGMLHESILASTPSLSPGKAFDKVDASSPNNACSSPPTLNRSQIKPISEIMEEQKEEPLKDEELRSLSLCEKAKQNSTKSKGVIDESLGQIKSLRKPGEAGPFEQAFHDSQKQLCMPALQGAKPKRPNMLQLNEATKTIISHIAQSGNCVLAEEVKRRLCHEFRVENLNVLGIRKPEKDIIALNDLIKLQAKVR